MEEGMPRPAPDRRVTALEEGKKALRRAMRAKLLAISPEDRAKWSGEIARRVQKEPAYRAAERVMLFASMAQEVDTLALIEDALSSGKQLYLPRVRENGRMDAVRVTALSQLARGAYGILEPTGQEVTQGAALDLVIAPGVAFDEGGGRLGHGGGYYDRFLDGVRAPIWALAFACQMVFDVPRAAHDLRVDKVVTEQATYGQARDEARGEISGQARDEARGAIDGQAPDEARGEISGQARKATGEAARR
ncbi:MAG: 5-formyltetrahydrofolate cyclo-ligase [Clostridia bacterium]